MRFRPAQARWFETYVPREHTVHAVEVLARTGVVELETDRRGPERVDTTKLRFFVERFRELAAAHAEDLPAGSQQPTALVGSPVRIANQALHKLRLWSAQVDYAKEHLAELRAERDYLLLLDEALEAMQREGLDLEAVFRHTRFLCKCLFACPKGCCGPEHELQPLVKVLLHGPRHDFPFLVGLPDQRSIIRRMVLEEGCEQVGIPAWLTRQPGGQRVQVGERLAGIEREIAAREAELAQLRTDPEIATAHANIDTLAWYLDHAAAYLTERELCHVTGWTTAPSPEALQRALREAGIEVVVRFPDPPASAPPPVATLERWWTQPFRPLLLMWGVPGREEVDPSGLLALVVPLLFGYMFPDVGHGLVLALFALFFSRRWPQIRFLLPCGISAMAFGVLFGEVFGFEDVVPALWLRPLDDPTTVLAVPLLFGVLLMLLGLVFAGIEAHWRGALRAWLAADAAVLLLYLSLLLVPLLPQVLWVTGLALNHYIAGSLWLATPGRRLVAMFSAIGQLLLSVFELVINTLSFLRVGAFALAHAALSHAVMTLAADVENPIAWLAVVIVGNAFSVILEGLVVFVQTTRLILFEFFIRFLKADGRLFRPVPKPPAHPARG
ncbi:MAG: V-type ATPase 116kDa subunit family protein [Thiobacillaceae bacterium]